MSPFPPEVVNGMAFESATRLIESSAGTLHMELYWRPEEWVWECQFVTDNDTHYQASHPVLANAIFDAAEQVPQ